MNELQDKLESEIVDKSSLADTLYMLAQICYEKADHIESTWQDKPLSRVWHKAGIAIDKLASKQDI